MEKPEIIQLGSLYFDDFPVFPGTSYNNKHLAIGDTEKGKELEWIQYNGNLYGTYCVCLNISWDQINDHDFVYGAKVWIDGKQYLCRCLKVGNATSVPNEWGTLMDKFGEADSIWHWTKQLFWGQEVPEWEDGTMIARVARGFHYANYWTSVGSDHQLPHMGFRPVLEPITPLELSDALVGRNIKVYLPQGGFVEGLLVGSDKYDLLMDVENAEIPTISDCAAWQGEQIVINKNTIVDIADKHH